MPISYTFTGDTMTEVFMHMRDALAGASVRAADSGVLRADVLGGVEVGFSRGQPINTHATDAIERTEQSPGEVVPDKRAAKKQAQKDAKEQAAANALNSAYNQQTVPPEDDGAALATIAHPKTSEGPAIGEVDADISSEALVDVEVEIEEPPPLDYLKDVTPRVLAYVNKHGKEAALALLGEFGVSNAKLIAPELWPELLERLA